MTKLTVRDIPVKGRKVLLRADLNVPLDPSTMSITDDSRIRATIPTIDYLLDNGASIIICSHLGRPGGKLIPELSLRRVAERLSEILREPVPLTKDCVSPEVTSSARRLVSGEIMMLENLRFHIEEEHNDAGFARHLASLADVYVNDAFGTSHRAHASIVGVPKYLPGVAGLLLEKEITSLGKVLEDPARPFSILLGGAKISDKVGLLENIMDKVSYVLIGGGMAATFLKAMGYEVGPSLIDGSLDIAARIIERSRRNGIELILPEDVVVADNVSEGAAVEILPADSIRPGKRIVDIGSLTISKFTKVLERSRTIFWNGPVGIYEVPRFAEGTRAMANVIANANAVTIIGGGSTAEILNQLKLTHKMTFVSTGGGAALKFLSGEPLPGVVALKDRSLCEVPET